MSDIRDHDYGGRRLTGHDDSTGESVAGWPEVIYEAMRAINHLTNTQTPIPAPVVYDVLGNLKGIGHMLPQALDQLGTGLTRSLTEYDVYDRKGDPAESVTGAREHLDAAAALAQQLAGHLEAAQVAINSQGYETPDQAD